MKGKPLLPTLRSKKRYLAYQVIGEPREDMFYKIRESFRASFGSFALAKAGLVDLKLWNGTRGIIKVNREYLDQLKAAICLLQENVLVRSTIVSGTLKKAKMEG
ncbi:MAG: hypothetical protein HGA85_03370 [Nanoarchaeota archaeon]|nr:hypothetical protein [Nanoarchaeota archaeon]